MNTRNTSILGVLVCAAATGANPEARAADIEAFGWLAGHWCLERDGEYVEEYWLPPRGGLIIAMGRTVAGKARAFEFLRIDLRDGVPTLVAQPNGVPPTEFRLTASGADWARFENPRHDFPKRVEYRRTATGMHAEIAGPGADGREKVIPFDYQTCVKR